MRSKKVLIIAGFLVAWTYVTYYFLMKSDRIVTMYNPSSMTHKVKKLEHEAHNEYIASNQMMRNMLKYLRLKFASKERNVDVASVPDNAGVLGVHAPPTFVPNNTTYEKELAQESAEIYLSNGEPVIPILIFACNRITITKCLDNLIKYRPRADQFPIIVSQDCGDEATKSAILKYKTDVTLIQQPDQSDISVPPKEKKFKGYYKIARHYGWALNTTFQRGYEFVVIVEDDLDVAPDFFEYFLGTHQLLKQDNSLWCVSAWNDNGKSNLIDSSKPELLYRTDFFPGLGWMLTKNLWNELSVKWPKSFWDDWIRHPEQRKNRVCIRPEISRTRTFGKIGVSNGLFFDKHLKYIKLSEHFVPFSKMNLSYLLKENYDNKFLKEVYMYPVVTYDELRRNLIRQDGPVRIQYNTRENYKRMTKILGLMDDFKSGVPRTAYHGVVSFFYNKRRVYLAPNMNWKGYDLSWS